MENYKEKLTEIINSKNIPLHDIDVLIKYFPELKESEDEKIRKFIKECIEEIRKCNPLNADHNGACSEAIAWLEKQKEQKPVEWSEEDDIRFNHLIGFIQEYGLRYYASTDKVIDWIKSLKDRVQPQLKQEWSEDDEKIIDAIYQSIDFLVLEKFGITEDKVGDWLKSLKTSISLEVK